MKVVFRGLVFLSLVYVSQGQEQSVGVATDPISYDSYPDLKDDSLGESYQREPQVSQEISSPAHIVSSKKDLETGNAVDDSSAAENSDGTHQSNESTSKSSEPEVYSGVEAVILSLMGMHMNQSRNEDAVDNQVQQMLLRSNCTAFSCLYGTEADITTQPGSNAEEDETATVENSTEKNTDSSAGHSAEAERAWTENSDIEQSEGRSVDNPALDEENEIVHDDEDGDIIIPEEGANSNNRAAGNRLLFFPNLAEMVGGAETIVEVNEEGDQEITIIEPNSNITERKLNIQFMTSSEQESRWLPHWNLTNGIRELDVPDIVPSLKRCGVFPACSLTVTAPEELVNYDAFAYEHLFKKKITSKPQLMKKTIEVTCDPSSVSIMAACVIILAVVIILSNFLIIVVTLRTRSLRKPHGYFKISLAVADLLNGAFVLTNISSNLVRFIYFNEDDVNQLLQLRRLEPSHSEASFFGICAVLSQVITVYSVLLLSVDSFLSIRWPMQYRVGDLMTTKRAIVLISTIWIFALAVSALPILAEEYIRYGLSYATFSYFPILEPLETHMSRENAFIARYIHVILYALLVWGIPFLCTWLLTVLTAYHSRGMLRNMSKARQKGQSFSKNIGRLERDILRTVSIVLAMLTITVLPMLIALIVVSITASDNLLCMEQHIVNLLFAAYYILVCGSFVNVIVYNACHKEFRRAMLDFLCDIITCMFSWICPTFCDLRSNRSSRSFRSKTASSRGTRRTTLNTDTYKIRKFVGRKLKAEERPSNTGSERTATLQSSLPGTLPSGSNKSNIYGRILVQQSESVGSDIPSSSRTFSTDTSLTSAHEQSLSSDGSSTPRIVRKQPAERSVSCSSVFSSSLHEIQRAEQM